MQVQNILTDTKPFTATLNTVKFLLVTGALIMASLCAPTAYAGAVTTLTYDGPDFRWVSGNEYLNSMNVSGTLSFAGTLGDNLSNAAITPSTFSFFDGEQTLTDAGSYSAETFKFTTSATGQITAWQINIAEGSGTPNILTEYLPSYNNGTTIDVGQLGAVDYGEYYGPSIGSWTETTLQSSAPEPFSVVLMSSALLALAFVARKRVARPIRRAP